MKKIVIANWKNHPESLTEAKKIFQAIDRSTRNIRKTRILVCPPVIYLESLSRSYRGSRIAFGAQDISEIAKGASTGSINGTMLKRAGATYVLVGHSEMRRRGDTDSTVSKKLDEALKAGLIPILCVGENERDKDAAYLQFLDEEIRSSLSNISKTLLKKICIAYEPSFAIGKTAKDALDPHDLHRMVLFIRKVLVGIYGRSLGMNVSILYGASVEPGNISALASVNIDGFLVGHASLELKNFKAIVEAVEYRS